MTAEVRQTLEGLDEEASVGEVATRLEGRVSPAVLALVKAQVVRAGGFGAVTRAVEGFGGFAKQYEQIEKVSAHHGNFWEVLLYGQISRDRAVMFGLADNDKLKLTATSEDSRVLDALAHAQRHQAARGEYITAFNEEGKEVDISFATQNWRKAVLDKTRTGQFVRKHFEAMVFTALAEEPRTGDVAVVGSEGYADWSERAAGAGDQGEDAGAVPDGDRGPDRVLGGVVAPFRPAVRQRAQAHRPLGPLRDRHVRQGHQHGPVRGRSAHPRSERARVVVRRQQALLDRAC